MDMNGADGASRISDRVAMTAICRSAPTTGPVQRLADVARSAASQIFPNPSALMCAAPMIGTRHPNRAAADPRVPMPTRSQL